MVVLLYRSRVPLLLLMILLLLLLMILLLLLLGSLFLFRLYYRSHVRPQIDLVWILHLEVLRKALWIHVAPRFEVPVVILSGVAAAGIVEGPPPDLCRGQCLVPIRQVSDFLGGEIGQGGGRSDKADAPHQPVFGGLGSVVSDGFQAFLFPPELLGGLLRKGRRRRRRLDVPQEFSSHFRGEFFERVGRHCFCFFYSGMESECTNCLGSYGSCVSL
mmetsp:Transcript_18861/g.52670  ORF Transcript_18861/g.52670 Transcript_18861/m.52670 type:complete len:216 (+) Transcript_18861:248-895(+)